MYAVIESGGKQYRVELGSEIQVDRLDAQPGDSISLDRVLLVADDEAATVGRPFVDGAVVNADVVDQPRGEKVVVFKYRPKARRRVKKGFRASLTTLRISDIAFGGTSAARDAAEEDRRRERAEREAEKAAAQQAAADQALASRLAETTEKAPATSATPRRARATKAASAKARAAAAPADETGSAAETPVPEFAATDETVASEAGADDRSEPPAAPATDGDTETDTTDKDE
jgi:large subunit ribosomal protein L21